MNGVIEASRVGPPDADVRVAALDLERHVIAVAPAGSGKTGLLVQRLLAALGTVETPEQVVAMTFTNKAAAEIRTRALGVLERAAAGAPAKDGYDELSLASGRRVLERDAAREPAQRWSLTANPERLRATTIDGLQAQIAAELPLLSGLGGRPNVVDDAEALYEEAILGLFGEIEDSGVPPALKDAAALWLRAYGNRVDRLIPPFADLLGRREQWQHALADDFDWAAQDQRVLDAVHRAAQTRFTDLLATEEREALTAIVREGSAFIAELAPHSRLDRWPDSGAPQAAHFDALVLPLLTAASTLRKPAGLRAPSFPKGAPHTVRLKTLLDTHAGNGGLEAAAVALQRLPPGRMPEALAAMRDALRVLLRRLLAHLRSAMGERGETDFVGVAEAARAALRPREQGGFGYGEALLRRDAQLRHLLVDEMQDTSESQLELLRNLTLGWTGGDGRSLFLVGDPQQSIYSFRKAEVRLFQKLLRERKLGELDLMPLRLTANFRSEPAVVEWFNGAFQAIFPPQDDELAGEVAYAASAAARPVTADAQPRPAVRVHVFAKDGAATEARGAAEIAAGLVAQAGPEGADVAILVRARAHVRATLVELRRLGVRAACTDVDPLAELPAVRDVLAMARALWHPEDRLSWAILLRAPFVGLSWGDLVALSAGRKRWSWPRRLEAATELPLSDECRMRVLRLRTALARVQVNGERTSLPDRVETLWTTLGGPACMDGAALGDVRRTFALLREHASDGLADEQGFERAVGQLYATGGDGVVQVMTIHKAKGLEFEHVILVGAGRKSRAEDRPLLHFVDTPHGPLLVPQPPRIWPDSDAKIAAAKLYDFAHRRHVQVRSTESLRLLYVAATRARKTLDIAVCADRDEDGELAPAGGSFAAALLPALDPASLIRTAGDAATGASVHDGAPPRAPRLPPDFELPPEQPVFEPREQRALRPSEAVLSAGDCKRVDDTYGVGQESEDVYAQLVGTLYHQSLAKIAEEGLARWGDGGVSRTASLRAGFRRLGMPEPLVEPAVRRVLELVRRTLASATGRWLLGPHPWAQSEYALAGFRDGRWVSALLDRCFETDNGELWVVDYKAAARRVAADLLTAYVADATERYRPQLALYAGLLAEHRAAKKVRSALYFIEADRLVELG